MQFHTPSHSIPPTRLPSRSLFFFNLWALRELRLVVDKQMQLLPCLEGSWAERVFNSSILAKLAKDVVCREERFLQVGEA